MGRLFNIKNKFEITALVTNVLNNTATTSIYDQYAGSTSNYGLSRGRNGGLQAELLLRFRN
ncbi:hypothetical protein ACN28S_54385 [Cystobacter fuscus]